jgi:4-aminobutyrate aminotransferase
MTTNPAETATRSAEVARKLRDYLWPAVTHFYRQPLVPDHASMQHVWDIEGRQYLDFFGGVVTISVGHANPKVANAVKAQVGRLQHLSSLYPTEAMVNLAEKVAQITPGALQSSFFSNSGTEANESAIQLARAATGLHDVIALRHSYSGVSTTTKGLTGQSIWRKSGVVPVGVSHAINPYCYRCPLGMTYPDCEVACANDVESLIQTGTGGQIAAFIAEPIQGSGGFITPPLEYFKLVFLTVKKYGGLFIADEVQTGFGRTGKHWFGIEHWEVVPDIMTCAKGMANGAPIGATITTRELAASYQGSTFATFGGNPVTCVAARATIEVIEEENLRENAQTMGAYFRAKLNELQEKYPVIGDVRGMGLMQGLELVKDRKTKEPAPEALKELFERTRENGLLIGRGGLHGNVVRLSPMLNIGKADIDEAIRLLDNSFAAVRI